jgi:type I restriction enzyme M protein
MLASAERKNHTMTLNEILKQAKDVYSLELFGESAVAAIEARLSDKNGKPYVKCLVRGKEVQAKPEEVIRQLWIHRLENHYGYPSANSSHDCSYVTS